MAIMAIDLCGLYPAIVTPMKAGGEIDYPTLDNLIEELIKSNVTGICACGTTGQSASLSHQEHLELAIHIHRRINGRCQYMASAGSNSTSEALHLTRSIEAELGPTTFLHVTGYYNNPPQKGIVTHFEHIADALIHTESNLILYNVPSRTGSNITAQSTIHLAQHSQIIGIKEASGDLQQCEEIIRNTDPDRFRLLTGECHQIAASLAMGGYGAISATANIAPKLLSKLVQAGLEKDTHTQELQQIAMPVINAVFAAKNPIPLAMMLNSEVRLPLVLLPEIRNNLVSLISDFCKSEDILDIFSDFLIE